MDGYRRTSPLAVVAAAYGLGAIPFSGMLARLLRGVDLRTTGTGTVSGTGLYRVAGLGPLLIGGILDLLKGTLGPLLAGRRRPVLAAVAGSAAVIGHNWSPYLGGAGGRGISPAMGSMLVTGWQGSVHLLLALVFGKLSKATSFGALLGYLTLPWVMWRHHRVPGLMASGGVLAPMLVKRMAGNAPLPGGPSRARTAFTRLLFDQDITAWPWWWPGVER